MGAEEGGARRLAVARDGSRGNAPRSAESPGPPPHFPTHAKKDTMKLSVALISITASSAKLLNESPVLQTQEE